MGNCHTEMTARYLIDGQYYFVTVNWQGKTLADDPDRFYDIFDSNGICLNEGEPWHDDGAGIPTAEDVATLLRFSPSYTCAGCHPDEQHPDVDYCDNCKGGE